MIPELRFACAGFLLVVLLVDLAFDLPCLRASDTDTTIPALDAATHYYARVTAPRSTLSVAVAMVMAALSVVVGLDLASARCLACSALVCTLAFAPMTLALLRTLPDAKRLATGEGDRVTRVALARSIGQQHLLALAAMTAYVVARIAGFGD